MEEFKRTVTRNVLVRICSVSLVFILVKTKEDLAKFMQLPFMPTAKMLGINVAEIEEIKNKFQIFGNAEYIKATENAPAANAAESTPAAEPMTSY